MHKLYTVFLAASLAPFCLAQTGGQSPQPSNSGFTALVNDAKTRIKEMNVDQLKALQASGEKFTLIDVREDNEWDAGHAAGAVHLSKGVIEREIEKAAPAKDTKLVLYCGGGSRSALATDSLMKMGYSNAFSLVGGLGAYTKAGLPTEKPAESVTKR
jgi:rhodanese-related sulfurtransferase